jgi:hypothetical protein
MDVARGDDEPERRFLIILEDTLASLFEGAVNGKRAVEFCDYCSFVNEKQDNKLFSKAMN